MPGIYNILKSKMGQALFDWQNDTINAVLLADNYAYNDLHSEWSDITSSEVVGNGYQTGGQPLQEKSISAPGNNMTYLGADPNWIVSTITARYLVLYDSTQSFLICCYEFDQNYSTINGPFTIQITNGIYFTIS